MTPEELRAGMYEANQRLLREGTGQKIIYIPPRQRFGGLIGPCWALACRRCLQNVHDGLCHNQKRK